MVDTDGTVVYSEGHESRDQGPAHQRGVSEMQMRAPGLVEIYRELGLPEGVVLAPVGRRIGAWFLSIVLCIVTLFIGYVIWGLVCWSQGTTPALKVLKMKAWYPDRGECAHFWRMALREIIGGIAENILGWITELVSFIMFVSGREHQALHDKVAGTVVVYDPGGLINN